MPLFDSEMITKLEYLSLVSRRVFRGQLLAQRRTKQLGGGIEFSDHREYVAGDDPRYVDWHAYARSGDLLLKRFQEEQDLHVYFLVDASQSMHAGNPNKFDYVRKLTAALAYIALAEMDRVAIFSYSDRILEKFPLTRGKDQVLGLLRFLENLQSGSGTTDLARVARGLVHITPRSGLVVILSDFFDQNGFEPGIDLLRHRKFEPHLIQVFSKEESHPVVLGDIELEDIESGAMRKLTVTEAKLRAYQRVFESFLERLRTYARQYSMACTQSVTNVPFDELVLKMMRANGGVQ